jgi:hypothetical protein
MGPPQKCFIDANAVVERRTRAVTDDEPGFATPQRR